MSPIDPILPDDAKNNLPPSVVLSIEHLHKTFPPERQWFKTIHPEKPVLIDFSMQAREGEIVGVVGPNGCGKTTLFKMIAGLETPEQGTIQIMGQDPLNHIEFIRESVFLFHDKMGIGPLDRGREHLYTFGLMRGLDMTQIIELLNQAQSILDFESYWTRPAKTYSKGQMMRLALARMYLMKKPKLLMFDEPTNGLDFESSTRFVKLLQTLAQQKHTILIASHIVYDLKRIAHRLVGISEGKALNHEQVLSMIQSIEHEITA